MFDYDILMVDDSEAFCESVKDLIEDERDWSVKYISNGYTALEYLAKHSCKVMLLDLKMPGMSGLELLTRLNEAELIQNLYIIVLTGEITIENAVSSLQYGARDFVQKPSIVDFPDNFLKAIARGFRWQEERIVNDKLRLEKKKAIDDSQLIVKSVGHDMSGSYYGSLMLRLQMLIKKIGRINEIIENEIEPRLHKYNFEGNLNELKEQIDSIASLAKNGVERGNGVVELLHFFKELGEKLKHLGNAIAIERSHEKVINLNSVVHSSLHVFADSKLHENPEVEVVEEYDNHDLIIYASEEDLIRVFLNLIENSYKAMGSKGILKLKTAKEGRNAVAYVKDTGCGISEEKIDKIWRPDYTDWKNNSGTGLGLMICQKTVENSGGKISVNSTLGEGTEFRLEFELYKDKK